MPILVILYRFSFGTVGAHEMVEKGFDGCRPSNAYNSNDSDCLIFSLFLWAKLDKIL
jgi:hypothetical protein